MWGSVLDQTQHTVTFSKGKQSVKNPVRPTEGWVRLHRLIPERKSVSGLTHFFPFILTSFPFGSGLFNLLLLTRLPLSQNLSNFYPNHVFLYQLHILQSPLSSTALPLFLCSPATSGFHHGRRCSCFSSISPAGQPPPLFLPSFCLSSHFLQICLVFSKSFFFFQPVLILIVMFLSLCLNLFLFFFMFPCCQMSVLMINLGFFFFFLVSAEKIKTGNGTKDWYNPRSVLGQLWPSGSSSHSPM